MLVVILYLSFELFFLLLFWYQCRLSHNVAYPKFCIQEETISENSIILRIYCSVKFRIRKLILLLHHKCLHCSPPLFNDCRNEKNRFVFEQLAKL